MRLQHRYSDSLHPHDSGDAPGHAAAQSAGTFAHRDNQLIRLNLLRALQLHRRLVLGCAAVGVLLALVYAIVLWPVYTAESQIYVQPVQPRVMTPGNDQNSSVNAAAYDAYIQQQVQSAQSPAVLLSAMKALGPGVWQQKDESEAAAAERLGHAVDAARISTGYEVAITAHASTPELAARIANAVANSVAEKASGEGNAGDAQRIAVLRDERDRIQNELKSDYAEQDDLNKQLGMASVGTAPPDMLDDQITKTREELIKAQTDHDQAEAKFSTLQAGQTGSSSALDAEADDIITVDPGLSSMKTSLNQRRALLITQMANLTPDNPAYKLAADELAKINTSLDSMMNDLRSKAAARIQQKLRTDLERTARVEDQLNGQLRQLAHEAAGATPKLQRVNDLATDIVRLRNRYSLVDEQLHNFLLEDSAPGAVHLSVAAVPPLHPSFGKLLKGMLPLALGGLIFGLLAAVVANQLDPHIYIAADVEETLGSAPIAVLPDFGEVSDAVVKEHILRLAAAIDHASRKGDLQTCMFTGTSRYTGVSTVAERVKDLLEVIGRTTVLLDACGNPPHEGNEPGGNEFQKRQAAMRAEMAPDTLVLVDTAPLMLSAETEYLARSVDGAIVVVESGVTTRAQLLAAINTLQRLEIGTVGFVLNKVKRAKADTTFRQSLHDMEKHLFSQGASGSMWPVRWHGIIEEPAPKSDFSDGENVKSAAQHAAPYFWPEAAAHESAQQKNPPPEEDESPRSSSAVHVSQSHIAACAAEPVQIDYPATAPQRIQPPKLPDWFWEQGSAGFGDFIHLPANASEHEQESMRPDAESRMDRLRKLFMDIELSELTRNRATQPLAETVSVPRPIAPEAAIVLSRVFPAAPQPNPVSTQAAKKGGEEPPVPLAVRSEVPSPNSPVPIVVDEQPAKPQTSLRADDADDIRILPAKRGQY